MNKESSSEKSNIEKQSSSTKFEVRILRIISIKTEGYDSEELKKLIESIIPLKWFWPLIAFVILVIVVISIQGDKVWKLLDTILLPTTG